MAAGNKVTDEEVAPTLFPVGTPGTDPTVGTIGPTGTGPVLRTSIGPYVVDRVLGAGGMGVVYAAHDPKLDRKVAIKVLRGREPGRDERPRLLREARAMAKLSHPNVVTVYGADVDAQEIYLAMELVDGSTLQHWLRTHRSWRDIVQVLIGAGRGLAAAHAVGLVHRDFKPDNVLIDTTGRARVSDFGIASWTGASERSSPEVLIGTPRYMSPEQYGTAAVDARSDQYSFCLVMYEALYGEHPFAFGSIEELVSRVVCGERSPRPTSTDVPEWLERAIDRGLALDATERFASMTELVDELERNLIAGSLPLPDKPSIAVLPFHDLSAAGDHMADGVVESITAVLSRIRTFFVISRNSAFQYRGRDRDPRAVGRELGVAYLLEGSVQCVAARVRITVKLVEAATGAQLWADKYDGTQDEIFDLQDRITEHVAGALQPSIRHAEIERARRKRPVELGAYECTMRAMHHVWQLEKDEAAKGLELLDRALALDARYPLALALKAWCLAQHSVYNWVETPTVVLSEAVALADLAASLSADDPVVLAVLGTVHTFARNHGVARVMLERAVALDPNNAWALSRLGWLDVYADHAEPAAAHFERALRLSPFDPMNFNNYVGLASAKQVAGDDAAAADYFLRALQERPHAFWIHRNLAPALYGAGRVAEARSSRDAMMVAYPHMTITKYRAAMVFSPRMLARIADQLRALDVPDGEV